MTTKTETATWTIAYRMHRCAPRFKRVTNWAGTWAQAREVAGLFALANPDAEVYYVSSRQAEILGLVVEEDQRNILVDSGRRVQMFETGKLPAEILAQVPSPADARERWLAKAI